jgi:hypothetical protein
MADQGTAYELPPPSHDAELTEVRRGTPMGELLRWQVRTVADGHDPVGVSFDPNASPVVFEASNQIQMNTPPMPPAG